MLLLLVAASIQVAPPPVITPVAPPQPPTVTSGSRVRVETPVPVPAEAFTVRMSAGGRLIWQGNVRLARNQGVDFDQSLTQAPLVSCLGDYGSGRSDRQSIGFNLYGGEGANAGRTYRMSARWQRPVASQGCQGGENRTVQVERSFTLDDRDSARIEGDAGLVIELTRQD